MIKTSRSVQLVLVAATMASTFACSSKSGPTPIGSSGGSNPGAGGGAAVGGSDTGAGGTLSSFANPIPFGGSWANGTDNAAAIQGAFYILEDSAKDGAVVSDGLTHTDLDPVTATDLAKEPSEFDTGTTMPCVQGTAQQVIDPANTTDPPYDKIWGGGIGMNLNEAGGDGSTPMPFDAQTAGITGFEFKMTGDAQSATLRFKATQAGDDEDYCAKITPVPGQAVQVHFSDLKHMCWGDEGTLTLDVTKLEAIQWQIVTDTTSPHTVTNFCVTELGYLTD